MHRTDVVILAALTVIALAITVIGGLFHPATIAGAVARFVFSLS